MWVYDCFLEDKNEVLMWAQHDVYFNKDWAGLEVSPKVYVGTPFYIFYRARQCLGLMVGNRPSYAFLLQSALEIEKFDHRVLQYLHAKIAAYYRWLMKDVDSLPFEKDSKSYREYMINVWKTYLIHEVRALKSDLFTAEHIVRAVLYENTETGYKAEDELSRCLDLRYGHRCMELCVVREQSTEDNDEQSGFIYILVNPAFRLNFLKIGKTTRLPDSRAEEITNATGVPMRFYVVYEIKVSNCHLVEKLVHSRLAKYRVANNREFFELPLKDAIAVIEEVDEQVGT